MTVKQSDYEALLAEYSEAGSAIALLKQYRQYLEMLPSMRRASESLITIPLPIVRLRYPVNQTVQTNLNVAPGQVVSLPCDLAFLMCDPEWKVKTGAELLIFIHRPKEDFSGLLSRWRQTQILLDQEGYEWLMPHHLKHIYSDKAEDIYPLFVLFPDTPERIKRGLQGAYLPFVMQIPNLETDAESNESFSTATTDDL